MEQLSVLSINTTPLAEINHKEIILNLKFPRKVNILVHKDAAKLELTKHHIRTTVAGHPVYVYRAVVHYIYAYNNKPYTFCVKEKSFQKLKEKIVDTFISRNNYMKKHHMVINEEGPRQ